MSKCILSTITELRRTSLKKTKKLLNTGPVPEGWENMEVPAAGPAAVSAAAGWPNVAPPPPPNIPPPPLLEYTV